MDKRLITVSKYLAKYLRHAPQELGLTLQPGGWVPVDDLLTDAEKNGFPSPMTNSSIESRPTTSTGLPSMCRAN